MNTAAFCFLFFLPPDAAYVSKPMKEKPSSSRLIFPAYIKMKTKGEV